MGKFRITDPETGKSMTISGDVPPTQEDAAFLFKQQSSQPSAPGPNYVGDLLAKAAGPLGGIASGMVAPTTQRISDVISETGKRIQTGDMSVPAKDPNFVAEQGLRGLGPLGVLAAPIINRSTGVDTITEETRKNLPAYYNAAETAMNISGIGGATQLAPSILRGAIGAGKAASEGGGAVDMVKNALIDSIGPVAMNKIFGFVGEKAKYGLTKGITGKKINDAIKSVTQSIDFTDKDLDAVFSDKKFIDKFIGSKGDAKEYQDAINIAKSRIMSRGVNSATEFGQIYNPEVLNKMRLDASSVGYKPSELSMSDLPDYITKDAITQLFKNKVPEFAKLLERYATLSNIGRKVDVAKKIAGKAAPLVGGGYAVGRLLK